VVPTTGRTQKQDGALAQFLPIAIAVAGLALGLILRIQPILRSDFPLNDGALFTLMIEAIRDSRYALPAFVGYNGLAIPFAYPPLAFYVAAAFADFAHVDSISTLRVLPLLFDLGVLMAFGWLAMTTLSSRTGAAVAFAAFALMPGSYQWLLGGGGLTRAAGLTFALLSLRQVYVLSTTGSNRAAALTALFAGLTALSHLEMAWFLACSGGLVYLAFGRTLANAGRGLAAAGGALVVSAPWWLSVLLRHGLGPFAAAAGTGSVLELSGEDPATSLVTLGVVLFVVSLSLLGHEALFLASWLGVITFLNTRSLWLVAIPIALVAGRVLGDLLIARLVLGQRVEERVRVERSALAKIRRVAAPLLAALMVVWALQTSASQLYSAPSPLEALTAEDRAAMTWVEQNTDPASRFLIIAAGSWARDRVAEWFPLYSYRTSVTTPQGAEWLPDKEFNRRLKNRNRAQACGSAGAACLAAWSATTGVTFTHVYLPKSAGDCCTVLREELRRSPDYRAVYESPAAIIFERRGP
jgi:hypothetical protein